uniref:Phospholipase A2-like central domain-containing protein n=1 Tax=Strigamia maritima TaxID=126957 RepID=T1IHG3_STRMM
MSHFEIVTIWILIFVKNLNPAHVVIYNHGLTTAVTAYGREGQIEKCHLFMEKTEDSPTPKIGFAGISVTKTTFQEMIEILEKCHNLNESLVDNSTETNKWQITTIFRGIAPGTMWCGLNDIAQTYDQLGSDRELDKCCRTHDHCPVRVQPKQRLFGLLNGAFYTKSHCLCDDILYNCLKKSKSIEAEIIGNIYFNFIQVQCVTENEKKLCLRNCKEKSLKDYKFVAVKRPWARG